MSLDVRQVSKALAGAVSAVIVSLLIKYGLDVTPEVNSAIYVLSDALIAAVIGYVVVYFAPKNTPPPSKG